MSQSGPIILLASADQPALALALTESRLFPLIEATWTDIADAISRLRPAAVIVSDPDAEDRLPGLAQALAAHEPYAPLIVVDPRGASLPDNAIPFTPTDGRFERLIPRLTAALRVRALHDIVLRRIGSDAGARLSLSQTDPLSEATVLLLGRGAGYPALSVALGERVGVVGTLSIEGAAKHLNSRDLDGIVIGEGFSPRVVDAFVVVMSEDSRFRHLPILVTVPGVTPVDEVPNLEIAAGDPVAAVGNTLPLFRQHALESRLVRMLQSLDAGGLLDPRTGLLTPAAFERDFATAVYQTQARGGALSVARFTFERKDERVRTDAARIASRLMRRMDFGTLGDDGALLLVLAGADLRSGHGIARRLASVMKQTSHSARRESRIDPSIKLATLLPGDSAKSLLARLQPEQPHAATG